MSGRRLALSDEAADANQAYGALTAEFYLSGFTFERAMARVLGLLKDGGWRMVGGGFDDVNDFVRSLRLDHLKVLAEQRKEFAERVKELQPEVSNRAIADALGVGRSTINRDAGPNGPRDARKAPENGRAAGPNAPPGALDGKRDARRVARRDEREERRERRDDKLQGLAKALPEGRFNVIYADPPWRHDMSVDSRAVENHYPTMTVEEICALKVPEICADDCTLYLWATAPKWADCLTVIEAWGFEYRTHFVWIKDKLGLGWHNRNQHELLLVAKRGALPTPDNADRISSVIVAPRGEHSAKPRLVMDKLGEWYPHVAKIEMFARGPAAPGWETWGNEAEAAP